MVLPRERFIVRVEPWHDLNLKADLKGLSSAAVFHWRGPEVQRCISHLSYITRELTLHWCIDKPLVTFPHQKNRGMEERGCAKRPFWNSGEVQNISLVLILNSWHAAFLFIFIRSQETWLWQTCVMQYKTRFIATLTSLNNRFRSTKRIKWKT